MCPHPLSLRSNLHVRLKKTHFKKRDNIFEGCWIINRLDVPHDTDKAREKDGTATVLIGCYQGLGAA